MWKNYSADYIRQNRASGYSIMIAAFIAALFLSFLCSLFYNFWLDNIAGTKLEDGDWHGRIAGEMDEDAISMIESFANVEKAAVNTDLSNGEQVVVDICFYNKKTVYQDMLQIVNMLGLTEEVCDYNYQLLSLYFVRIPGDQMPRLLMPAYLAVVILVCISLVLVIYNSFAVSQNNRIHQFGIFSSIGAAPGQILACLVQEAFLLSILPILAGMFLGVVFSFGTVRAINAFTETLAGGRQSSFSCSPVILIIIFLLSMLTVLISAWLPGRKLSRLTPLEAIRGTGEQQGKKSVFRRKKHFRILSLLFGMEGELAGNALWAQRKALRTTSLSLSLAFLGFMMMQCFWTLSGISTFHTYFEKYQDVWDVMATIKDVKIGEFDLADGLKNRNDADSCVVYQRTEADVRLPVEAQSRELSALGGPMAFIKDPACDEGENLVVKTSIFIMDDKGFEEYCRQIGVNPRLDGSIIWNCFWDSVHSNFRYPEYIPYVEEGMDTVVLQNSEVKYLQEAYQSEGAEQEGFAEIPVLALSQECPMLREEFGKSDYALVQFIPLSLWRQISGQISGEGKELKIRILAKTRESLETLNMLEEEIVEMIGPDYDVESENRIQEKIDNDKMIEGYELVLGAFCMLFAVIGIAHVFSNTMGFLRQRKREFARYMSIGLTPKEMGKMFCIEALVLAGRPMLYSLFFTILATAFMIKASYLNPMEFVREAPVGAISAFILTVFAFVAFAYYLGGRRMLKLNLAEALRDDTLI